MDDLEANSSRDHSDTKPFFQKVEIQIPSICLRVCSWTYMALFSVVRQLGGDNELMELRTLLLFWDVLLGVWRIVSAFLIRFLDKILDPRRYLDGVYEQIELLRRQWQSEWVDSGKYRDRMTGSGGVNDLPSTTSTSSSSSSFSGKYRRSFTSAHHGGITTSPSSSPSFSGKYRSSGPPSVVARRQLPFNHRPQIIIPILNIIEAQQKQIDGFLPSWSTHDILSVFMVEMIWVLFFPYMLKRTILPILRRLLSGQRTE